jgi:hypothetical protein
MSGHDQYINIFQFPVMTNWQCPELTEKWAAGIDRCERKAVE